MRRDIMVELLISLTCVFFIISFCACKTAGGGVYFRFGQEAECNNSPILKKAQKKGPPPHAPAHGYRAKYRYWYYPSSCIYFDEYRKVYFYLEGDNWRMSVSLPQDIKMRLGKYVTIEMDTDKPYTRFEEHKRKYPPGQFKKKKKNKKWEY